MMDGYAKRKLADIKRFEPQAKEILRELSPYMTEVCEASLQDDMERATDLNLVMKGTSIGWRCIDQSLYNRYHACIFRSRGPGDFRHSEVTRIMNGQDPHWFFYTWHDETQITHWILLDVDVVRSSEILLERELKQFNHGSNYFVEVLICELAKIDAIVTCDSDTMHYIFLEVD